MYFTYLFFLQNGNAQTSSCKSNKFSECAAIYLDNKMMVDDYSPSGKCTVMPNSKGILHVYGIRLYPEMQIPMDQVSFKVAIHNTKTNTMWMFSEETYQTLALEKVLAKCEEGDNIILLTTNSQYSLPHHKIEIMWGC